jgi:hypothetical protein
MRSTFPASILLAAVLAGCSSSEPNPPSFAVSPSQQWSGGTLTVRSSLFSGGAALPTVTAAGVVMAVARVNDTTITATLPSDLPTQSAPITIVVGSKHYEVGPVDVIGFRFRTQATPGFLWEPLIRTSPSGPVAVAGLYTQPAGGAISIVDLRTGVTQVETGVQPPQWASAHGVGASFQPGHLILRDSTGALGDWQFQPTLTYADTVPSVIFSRQVARLADQVWLFSSNHMSTVRRSGASDILVSQEDPWDLHLSPAADRALQNSWVTSIGGTPVFQLSTGDTVFRLGIGVHGAAFSADGTKLFVAGLGNSTAYGLWILDAATGTPLHQISLPFSANSTRLAGVGINSSETTLFVGALEDSVPEVLVYDAGTLDFLGRMAASSSTACVSCLLMLPDGGILTVDDSTGTIFLVVQGEPALIWQFDLLP